MSETTPRWSERFTEIAPLRRLGDFHLYRARHDDEPCVVAVSQAYVDPSYAKQVVDATVASHEAFSHVAVPTVLDHNAQADLAYVAFACPATHDLGHLIDGFEGKRLPSKALSALISLLIEVLATRGPQADPVRNISAANVLLAPDGRIWFLALGSPLLTHQGVGLPTASVPADFTDPAEIDAAVAGLAYQTLRGTPESSLIKRGWVRIADRLHGRGDAGRFANLDALHRALRVWWAEFDLRADHVELARLIAETLEPRVAVPEEGTIIGGRYRLDRTLGYGRRGAVFLGWDTILDESVALKWVDHQDDELQARLFREVGILRQIRHPHIVGGFDLVLEPGARHVAVMEYVPGDTLADLMARGEAQATLLHHLVEVADALDYLESKRIVHREVKPANIIVGQRGAVLVDLGIARRADIESERITRDYERLGAFRYMTPEQTGGGPATPATDVYAFARVVLEVLVPDAPPLVRSIDARRLMLKAGVPDDLAELVAAALDYEPEKRPRAAALREAIRTALSGAADTRVLDVAHDGRGFALDGVQHKVSSRAARRILVAFANAQGRPLNIEELFAAGWPGERIIASAQKNRVFVALTNLRKSGLEGRIMRIEDGYLLDPALTIALQRA